MSRAITLTLIALLLIALPAWAQDPVSDFKQNCSSCHTIGGGVLTGPDLKDVEARKDRGWLARFILDPGGVLDSGDPYAATLLEAANNVRMPTIGGMTRDRAEKLLELIAAESLLEKSQFAGVQISDRPFTQEDIDTGRLIFTGQLPLTNGGTACISCHTVTGLGGLAGGALGPDLTRVFERYENRRRLGAWLSAPATPTMLPTFRAHPMTEDEILPLLAWFQSVAGEDEKDPATTRLILILLGLGGAGGLLALLNTIWGGRLRGVRKPLVASASLGKR